MSAGDNELHIIAAQIFIPVETAEAIARAVQSRSGYDSSPNQALYWSDLSLESEDDDDQNLIGLDVVDYDKDSFLTTFAAIAPYVREGSWIVVLDEDNQAIVKLTFDGHSMNKVGGYIQFDDHTTFPQHSQPLAASDPEKPYWQF